jgi:hypothetical protein
MGPTSGRAPPRLHLAVLCSYVELDGNDQPFSLVEPMYGVAILPAANGRLPAPAMDLYVQLDDEHAAGTYWFSVQVRRADPQLPAGRIIDNGQTRPEEVTFAGGPDPLRPFEHVFTLRNLVFPEPGWYHFHVMCNHLSLHDRERSQPPLRLRVMAAERPTGGSPDGNPDA